MKIELDWQEERLIALPAQVIRTPAGAIVRRGTVKFQIDGEGAYESVCNIVDLAGTPAGASREDLVAQFPVGAREMAEDLIDALMSRRVLARSTKEQHFIDTESRQDIFLWNFDSDAVRVQQNLDEIAVALVGVNRVTLDLAHALARLGFANIEILDHPAHRNLSLGAEQLDGLEPIEFSEWSKQAPTVDFMVVASDFGGLAALREWSAFCVNNGINFMPAVVQDNFGYVGPITIPGRSACFECVWRRQNSNLGGDAVTGRITEMFASQAQAVDGTLDLFCSVTGQMAAFEVFRYHARALPGFETGMMQEIDFIGGTMKKRKVLRVPHCPACGSRSGHGAVTPDRSVMVPGNPLEG